VIPAHRNHGFDPASVFKHTLMQPAPSLPALFLQTIKKLPPQPAGFYTPRRKSKFGVRGKRTVAPEPPRATCSQPESIRHFFPRTYAYTRLLSLSLTHADSSLPHIQPMSFPPRIYTCTFLLSFSYTPTHTDSAHTQTACGCTDARAS